MQPETSQWVGILGGTFDPIHYGHLRLAQEAQIACNMDEVRFIPAGHPPHRGQPHVSAQDRLKMVQLAIADNPRFKLDGSEVADVRASYTLYTLQRLRAELGETVALGLIVGADAFLGLPAWHKWEELFTYAHLIVATRPSYSLDVAQMPPSLQAHYQTRQTAAEEIKNSPAGKITSFTMTALDISATSIRRHLYANTSVRYLLPDPVLDYIVQNDLYINAA